MSNAIEPAIPVTGGWRIDLLELGRAEHPGEWVGPGFPDWIWSPVNGLLLRRPGRTILVDAGSGVLSHLWAFDGIVSEVPEALAAAGVRADAIDLVLLTHLDDDHIGGLLAGSWPESLELAFGQARVLAPRAGLEAVAAGEGLPVGVEERRRVVALLENAGVVETFEPGDEIAPGVRVRDAPGIAPATSASRSPATLPSSTSPTRCITRRTSSTPNGTGRPTTTGRSRSRPGSRCSASSPTRPPALSRRTSPARRGSRSSLRAPARGPRGRSVRADLDEGAVVVCENRPPPPSRKPRPSPKEE